MKEFKPLQNWPNMARRRLFTYLAVAAGLAVSYISLRGSVWQGSSTLHTVMEAVATVLALTVGAMALVRFYSRKEGTFLFIGAGFLGTAFLDGYHALVTSAFLKPYMSSDLPALIPWSWVASRQFLSIFLLLSWLAWLGEQKGGRIFRFSDKTVYVFAAVFSVVCFVFFAFAPLPRAYYPEFVFSRPEEFLPALFFLAALAGYLRKGKWKQDVFEHWLVLSLVIGLITQTVFMSVSGQLFDLEFDVAHLLKKISYVCVLTGLLGSMFSAFRLQEQRGSALLAARNELKSALSQLSSQKLAMDAHSIVATTDLNGTITYANDKFCEISKYSREELIGSNHGIVKSGHHPRSFYADMYETIRSGHPWRGEFLNRAKDGAHYWVETTIVPIKNTDGKVVEYVAIQTDITNRKQIETVLQTNADLLKTTFDSFPGGIAVYTGDLTLQSANPAFYRLLDLPANLFPVGAGFEDIVRFIAERGEYGDVDVDELVREQVGRASRYEQHTRKRTRPEGTSLEISVWPLSEGGHIAVYMDITATENMMAEISQQNERFDAALNNMSEGLCMFDGAHRLIVSNACFGRMYGLSLEQMEPGTSLRRLLEHQVASGACAGSDADEYIQDYIDWISDGKQDNRVFALNDGRKIEARFNPMAGAACLITYADVTHQIQAQIDIEASNRMLEIRIGELEDLKHALEEKSQEAVYMAEDLRQARDIQMDAIHNISEGFSLWDKDDKLIMCNMMFNVIYGGMDDVLEPGVDYADFVLEAYQRGILEAPSEDLEKAVDARVERHRGSVVPFDEQLADGRWIRVSEREASYQRIVGIVTDITAQKRSESAIKELAETDALTGLPNRILFHERLQNALDNAKRTGLEVGVMLLDLDHFKNINDTLGHPTGDALLRKVADRLGECVRVTDTVARLGGDEFAVIATNLHEPLDIDVLANRMVAALAEPYNFDGQEVHSGASIGITLFPEDSGSSDDLLRNADIALYRAKAAGRGSYRLYDKEMNREVIARRTIERDLRRAIENDDLDLWYQPQVDLSSGQVSGAEALVRWSHPERGMISPAEFIPVAETTRLIIPLGEWVLNKVCWQCKEWQDGEWPPIVLAVNMSPLQFKHIDMLDSLKKALDATQLDPQYLELEITEGAAMDKSAMHLLQELKQVGVKLAIDDFGTGYSSLSRLKNFPVDRLKIDKSFVKGIDTETDRRAICSAIVKLGNSLNLRVLAEGVETIRELEVVRELGCHEIQGFLCAPALPPKAFIEFLNSHNPNSDPVSNAVCLSEDLAHSA